MEVEEEVVVAFKCLLKSENICKNIFEVVNKVFVRHKDPFLYQITVADALIYP